ncbi:hypothetical protein GCM10027215_05560 [Nocardioides zeae]
MPEVTVPVPLTDVQFELMIVPALLRMLNITAPVLAAVTLWLAAALLPPTDTVYGGPAANAGLETMTAAVAAAPAASVFSFMGVSWVGRG